MADADLAESTARYERDLAAVVDRADPTGDFALGVQT
jgi:hypothetical protein